MEDNTITSDSSIEEVANALTEKFKLRDNEKSILINESISGDVLFALDVQILQTDFKFRPVKAKNIANYLNEHKENLKPKDICDNIQITNEAEIKSFFEKYIGFKGELDGIKNENELKELKEEDMKKLKLNFGQRIRLSRYINHFNSIKEKTQKEIKITITRDSNDEEALNFLLKELKISKESIENLGLDADISKNLFGPEALSEDDLNSSLKNEYVKQEEYDILIEFIKKRDEKFKQETITISKESTKEDISKFLKDKFSFDLDNQNINDLNPDLLKNITKEEKEIIQNFINEVKNKQKGTNIDKNYIYKEDKIGNESYEVIKKINNSKDTHNKPKIKKTIEDSNYIFYSKKEKVSFKENYDYNIFFVISIKEGKFTNLKFGAFQKKGYISSIYTNYDMYLLNISTHELKDEKYFFYLFQIVSDYSINKISVKAKDEDYIFEPQEYDVFDSINIKEGNYNFFIFDTQNYFSKIYYDDYFNEYLGYFFDEKLKIKNTIKKDLIKALDNEISNSKYMALSPKNILKFIECCGNLNIEPIKLDNIIIYERVKELNKKYYITKNFVKDNFKPNTQTLIITLFLKIYSIYDFNELIDLISEEEYCKIFFQLFFINPIQIKTVHTGPDNKVKIKKLKDILMKFAKNINIAQQIINFEKGIENSLETILEHFEHIINIIDKEVVGKTFNGFIWNIPDEKDNIELIVDNYKNINLKLESLKKGYYLLKIQDIFEKMVDIYKNKKSLDEYLLLNKFIDLDKEKKIPQNVFIKYQNNIHLKGMDLIQNNKMTTKEIINFIKYQDYFYSDNCISHPKRDTEIFKYIKITSKFKDYKESIKLIKEKELYKLYDSSPLSKKDLFYSEILKHIDEVNEMERIYEIFPSEKINGRLLQFINEKMKKLLKSVDKNNCNISYSLIDKWIISNYNDRIIGDLGEIAKALNEFNQFTSAYYLYFIKKNDMKIIINELKNYIISFFIEQNLGGLVDEKILITLLKDSPDDDFCLYFVQNIDTKILKEIDFYTKEVTPNFEFFTLFSQNCNKELEEKLKGCKYIIESTMTQSKIIEDLKNKDVQYEKMNNLILDDNIFLDKIKVLIDKDEAETIFKDLKDGFEKCKQKLQQLELINDYYNQFYKESKKDQIILIKNKLKELNNANISFILAEENFFKEEKNFDFYEALEDCKKLKYRNSKFFMAIYEKNKDKKSEDERFNESIKNYHEVLTNIITLKENNLKFFELSHIHEILKVINNYENNLQDEIDFTSKEFEDLKKEDYIKNELLNDLINYSKKDKTLKLLNGIKCFIEIFKEIKNIEQSDYYEEIKNLQSKLAVEDVSKEEITETINKLIEKGFDINNETLVMKFYKSIKKDAILFLKTLMNLNFEIRNLNEFVVENASELQTSHIDNLIYVYEFFVKIFSNQDITNDKILIDFFGKEMNNNQEICDRIESYQKIYGEIKRVYQSYVQNPVMTHKKIKMILGESFIEIFKDDITNEISFQIKYKQIIDDEETEETIKIQELEELRNKILLSLNNSKNLNNENEEENADKKKTSDEYLILINNIKQLISYLNSLLHTGYPHIVDFKLNIKNSLVVDEDNKILEDIMEGYKKKNDNFINLLEEAYEKFPLLRLFYGQQFIQLFNQTKNKEVKNIFHLINSVTLNKVNNLEIDYEYNDEINELENINQYLELLFKYNDIYIDQLYEQNKVSEDTKLTPGLYRRVKTGDNEDIINLILNIYLNITDNVPIINTLLVCNEDTTIENVQSFLYRAIFCDKPILFVISNIECMELSTIKSLIKISKTLYKEKKNRKINSYVLFLYEKIESGLARFLEKLIPEKNNLDISYLQASEKKYKKFEKIEVYSADFSGYGKTTEIKNKAKENKGNYFYLPIGGTLTRDYIIKNLLNLNIDLKKGKENYLHLDLSETDNDNLMIEILFKLIIMKYIDSKRNVYYLGYDINIMIELPKGFYNFKEKYRLLNSFNNIHIKQLKPLRLEEGAKYVKESDISIVAEVLDLFDKNQIEMKNIDLEAPIAKTAEECEKIINKYFTVENQNYYQKMNFIKILAIEFKKFTNNYYMNYEQNPEAGLFLIKIRKTIINNFIELTKVFTRSPYDSILLIQEESRVMFGKINENQAKEEELMKLADESNKQEIFSFEKIKPSLVFFNKDGSSLSIISNNDKNEKNYKDLHLLWNLGNQELNFIGFEELVEVANYRKTDILNDLKDYKNLKHEEFLEQIKIIFCLDTLSIDDLKNICEKLGNYIFVSDNFIKMVAILLNIEAKIPVILMGETGVGKTKLLEMLATLYGKGKPNWRKLQIHAGTTDQDIVEFIEGVEKEYQLQENNKEKVWIFFDEINTCNSLGLITEIMCNHTYLGKKINENFVFLGACNPYRIITKNMKMSGLVYYNTKEKNKLNNLVYTVNPLPHSLLNFVFDFGSLKPEDEKKYITNTIIDILSRFKKKNIIEDFDKIEEKDIELIQKEIIESIVICHDFMRKKYDRSSVSLREIRRFGIFFEYFIKYFNKNNYESLKNSLNMTLYLCYYLRLNDKKCRNQLSKELENIFKDFCKIPEYEIRLITEDMERDRGIALNRALRENLFTCFICIDNSVPLIIIGKPGTGKSLSFQILYNTLKGEYSEHDRFKEKGKLYRYYYQGSGTSTSEGIKQVFEKAKKKKKNSEINKNKIITLVFFDEMGLAERSSNNPLKIIHYLLEKDTEESVPFLGISNWKLDAAKINRALNLSITDYEDTDLEETSIAIAEALDKDIANRNNELFQSLAKTYFEYMKFIQGSLRENKDFHGNRDFYNLIKTSMMELIERKKELNNDRKKILTEAGLHALDRNFSGLEDSNKKIKELFKNLYKPNYEVRAELEKPLSVLDMINMNISGLNTRYLMLISEGNDSRDIVKYLLNSKNKRFLELIGSKYPNDINSGLYSEEILNKIKYIMETDNILILKDLDMIYPSLYDLFNQNFIIMGEKKFARIAFEYAKISSEVNKNFHVIVLVNNHQIENLKMDPPFLNRFEKHIINFNILLEERDKDIAKKITNYIELISSFNNNPHLKIDLDNLLINCRLHNIEGLIYKIKNNINDKNEILIKNGEMNYEEYLIREVFKIIVPTFCQDIIASMVNSGIKQGNYNDIILDEYNKSNVVNIISFLKKIKHRKNVIYTFSKITEDIFKENYLKEKLEIKTDFGIINKETIVIEMIESIKSESNLEYILKTFDDSDDKNLLILKFSEKDLDKISSIQFVLDNSEKKYLKLQKKLIFLLIHKQRRQKKFNIKKEEIHEVISFFDEDYYQIFIDNLHGKENLDIFKIMQKNNDLIAQEYIYNPEFIKNRIYMVINYLNYKVIFETKELNNFNFIQKLTEFILNNEYIQNQIITNLKKQRKTIKNDIKDVFISDNLDINDVDFIEVISTKLSRSFCSCLLKIIYNSLNDNILGPFLINKDIESLLKNNYFNNLINNYFEKTINPNKKLNMNINANEINIYNGLLLPKSKTALSALIKYFDGRLEIFNTNEASLRNKKYTDENKIYKKEKEYKQKLQIIYNDLKIEMMKNEYFKEVFNMNIDDLLLNEYLKIFVIKYIENKEIINYDFNEKLYSFLKFLSQIILNTLEKENDEINLQESIDKFVAVFVFTQGYKTELIVIFNSYLEIIKYCDNFEDIMYKYLEEGNIKYEQSDRNRRYTKIVNICLFNIIESFIRAVLLYSQQIKADKVKFSEFFKIFPFIETSLQKINKNNRLYSKEIYNLRNIIKIEEAYRNNYERFENNYDKIIGNLFMQSTFFYCNEFEKLNEKVNSLFDIFEKDFTEKNETYKNLMAFIFRQEYTNIYIDDIRIKLLEKFFNNESLVKFSKMFLAEKLKCFEPESIKENSKSKKETNSNYISNFMDLESEKFKNIRNILNICNKINLPEFDEILLYFFEGLCQNYFYSILKRNNNEYNEKCCNELLLGLSINYLKKAIKYLYEHKENNDNNLLKLYAIAFIKSYCFFYVEIHKDNFDKIKWDEVHKILFDDNDEKISFVRYIYVMRLYYKKFNDFDTFISHDFSTKAFPIINDMSKRINDESINEGYVFNESLITSKIYKNYKSILQNIDDENLNMDLINNNLDAFYCCLVNKILSFKYGKNKEIIHNKMLKIYGKTKEEINLENQRKILYEYLLNENLFESEISNKVNPNENLSLSDFEILLYSLRFVFNIKENDNKFYSNLLKPKASEFINNNYIPGSFQIISDFIKTYKVLEEKLKLRIDMGYYICKDCGLLYEVEPCTFPMETFECANGHICGGKDHISAKKDIRVFYDKADYDYLKLKWLEFSPQNQPWFDSFEPMMNLQEFKEKYVDKNMPVLEKGIIKNYDSRNFENLEFVRNMNIITFRLLNFILYSCLLSSYSLKNISDEEIEDYLIKQHNLFWIVKKNWELLAISLREKGIENVQIFINIIFDDIIEKINNLDTVDTIEKLNIFENDINDYIMNIISKKEIIEQKVNEYKSINKELNNLNPYCIKELIKSSFEPSVYDQNQYPDIQYYFVSSPQNLENFTHKFNSEKENEKKYFLINLLVNKDQEITKDAINLKNIENLNKLGNILINIFSYKISRDEAKRVKFSDKLPDIFNSYNKIDNQNELKNEEDFKEKFIDPFFNSWDKVKSKSIQYKCMILKNGKKLGVPLDMNMNNTLAYFLVDVGDQDGGIFLASAYEHLIEWQNKIINLIIEQNKEDGILNSYISQLNKEISIQEASESDIIYINEETYAKLEEFIMNCSMRNIFNNEGKINYRNYSDNIYDYDYIENELAKIILQGKKKFKKDEIKFVVYKYEEFRGKNSSILINFDEKYPKKELTEVEKNSLNDLLKSNANSKFYQDISSSLQLIMKQLIIDNHDPNIFLYDIIRDLPPFIILNEELKIFLENQFSFKCEIFRINTLISMFEYLENYCWEENKKQISPDFKLDLEEKDKEAILDYFEKNKNNEKKIINVKNFTTALRRLISRFLISSRQEAEAKPDSNLCLYIGRAEFWSKDVANKDSFENEIFDICKNDIKIGNSYRIYEILGGDKILNMELGIKVGEDPKPPVPGGTEGEEEERSDDEL